MDCANLEIMGIMHIKRRSFYFVGREVTDMLDLTSLKKALAALKLAFEIYDRNQLPDNAPEKIIMRDGVIQRFEFTFELSWKTLKRYLEEYGLEKVDSLNNRDLFRIGFEQDLLKDPVTWFNYLKMRNQTSHVYDDDKAAIVFAAAREFQQDAQILLDRISENLQ